MNLQIKGRPRKRSSRKSCLSSRRNLTKRTDGKVSESLIEDELNDEKEEEIDIVMRSETPEADRKDDEILSPKTVESTPEPPRSGEKRRKRINYLEMHTGKTSPLLSRPSSRISPSPKETGLKKSPLINQSKPAKEKTKKKSVALKSKKNLSSTSFPAVKPNDDEDVKDLPGSTSNMNTDSEDNNKRKIILRVNEEPLEYFQDMPPRKLKKISYLKINSSLMRRIEEPSEDVIRPLKEDAKKEETPVENDNGELEKKRKENSLER